MATPRRKGGGIAAAVTRAAEHGTPGATSIRTQPIRVTVDLDPGTWEDMQRWMGTRTAQTHTRVQMAPVVRALIAELVAESEPADDGTPAEATPLGDAVMGHIRGGGQR
jgi:hypothetical protein